MKNKPEKRYIIQKYILATSAEEAIKKEKRQPIDEVIFDYNYKPESMGFQHNERSGRTDKI